MENAVLFEVKNGVATIILNRPDRYNAVNQDLVDGISNSLKKCKVDESIRSVVITGSGRGFCAGADMSVFGDEVTADQRSQYIIDQYQPLMNQFFSLKKPIIGAINGTAAGVGAAFALACDLRVMSEKSGILYAFVNIGLGPDGGASWLLTRQVGYSRALEIATSGKKLTGQKCLELGLTNRLVAQDDILSNAQAWAEDFAIRPTLAIGIAKEDMFFAMDHSLNESIAFEAKKQIDAFNSYDLKEGVSAFIEKRKPNFLGK
ncbi:MAG: enoyl-CoA hydratase-related protein [Flavobacteriaceae bacterium]|nr:enoyl-CoA hydratase [Flavobacteriaceae bacterium]MDG2063282.1 enoyl-CoA hydratase-related protein [Flavobacteriaceae bacterium]|tara:strand:- start:250 stop:1032 length:783 start_codon:yes stop_codon:yes gene_type:complete